LRISELENALNQALSSAQSLDLTAEEEVCKHMMNSIFYEFINFKIYYIGTRRNLTKEGQP